MAVNLSFSAIWLNRSIVGNWDKQNDPAEADSKPMEVSPLYVDWFNGSLKISRFGMVLDRDVSVMYSSPSSASSLFTSPSDSSKF